MVSGLRFAAATLVLLLLGCAQDEPLVMVLGAATVEAGTAAQVWPPAPEVARYAYAGELTGEDNFQTADGGPRLRTSKVLAFILGLGLDEEKPLVLQRPQSGTTDPSGRVYVTDVSHQAVFVFDPRSGQLDLWTFARPGQRFEAPIGIAIAGDGTVLVTDAELGAVFRFDREGRPLGHFGDDVLVRPTGIARDPARGLIYVADTRSNDVKTFDEAGRLVGVVGRSGESQGELNAPTHIAFAGGRLYVTDTLNSRVQVFDSDGTPVVVLGKRGLFLGDLARPKGVSVDSSGNIYVVEGYFDHLLVYDRNGRFLLPIGGTGSGPGRFYLPTGVWTDARDRIYVADMFNGRISIFQYLGDT
jgi:DNA-binding beta-propeller fold protein YncE